MGSLSHSLNRTALITGGSSGIGKSLVKKLSQEKITTGFVDIVSPESVLDNSFFFEHDISKPDQVQKLYENLVNKIGLPDIIICNAGRGIQETLKDGDPEKWIRIFEINVFGALRIIRAFLPQMLEKERGDIVFISSVSSKHPYPGGAIYAATKASIDVIAETLRLEVQPDIRVTTISPGVVNTDFFKNIVHGSQTPESIGWGYLEPEDIADAIFYAINKPHNVAMNNIIIRPVAQPM
ncbi:SDR family oxidoreductase [soil metagenome]